MGLTTKPGSIPASDFRIADPFKPGSHAYAERHAVRSHVMMPGLVRVDIGGPADTPVQTPTAPEGTSADA